MATREHRRRAKDLIEALEHRVHFGPPIQSAELRSAREFLHAHEFSPLSDYFNRLLLVQNRVETRLPLSPGFAHGKRNYGGAAAGAWMQVQAAYDHVIVSTCYEGEFNLQPGRIKVSHRFNQQGRIDFVELKFLRSLHPPLNGEIRKLLLVAGYQTLRKGWTVAEAYVLPVLPRELVFLYPEIFRCPKSDVLAWLVNIGHQLAADLLKDLREQPATGSPRQPANDNQLPLRALLGDPVALPVLEHARSLRCAVQLRDEKTAVVHYQQHAPEEG